MNSTKWYQLILTRVIRRKVGNFSLGTVPVRSYATVRTENYYETLGITRKATQNDIKTAYYKLSMEYHPDKNKGSELAAQKFRDITEAYEVLGNFRLRRLYDKGIIHPGGSHYSQVHDPPVEKEEDAQTKFYKARMKRSTVPDATGRTPIYNFDEWSRAHYGSSFARKQASKVKHNEAAQREKLHEAYFKTELMLLGLVLSAVAVISISMMEPSPDIDKTGNQNSKT